MKKKVMNHNKYQIYFRFMGIVFATLMLVIFLLNLLLPSRSYSRAEDRTLQTGIFDDDQFAFRSFWLKVKVLSSRCLGQSEQNGVVIGKNKTLIETFRWPDQKALMDRTDAMIRFADANPSLTQYALIAPTAVGIMPEQLPAGALYESQEQAIKLANVDLSHGGINVLDVCDYLKEHKSEDLYYATDSHWTTQGAYLAFQKAAGDLGIDPKSYEYIKSPASYSFSGDLSARNGFLSGKKDELDVFLPKDADIPVSVTSYDDTETKSSSFYSTAQLDERNQYRLFFDGNHSKVTITSAVANNEVLLVVKDSYANCFVPFLAPFYHKIIMIDIGSFTDDLQEVVDTENVTQLLYLFNANTFFTDDSICRVLNTSKK